MSRAERAAAALGLSSAAVRSDETDVSNTSNAAKDVQLGKLDWMTMGTTSTSSTNTAGTDGARVGDLGRSTGRDWLTGSTDNSPWASLGFKTEPTVQVPSSNVDLPAASTSSRDQQSSGRLVDPASTESFFSTNSTYSAPSAATMNTKADLTTSQVSGARYDEHCKRTCVSGLPSTTL
jgi:hypothetical protein